MKALFVTTVSTTLQAFLLPFAQHFRSLGWHMDAAAAGASASPECQTDFDQVFEIEWTRNPVDGGSVFKAVRQIQAVVKIGDYDIVHVHTPIAAFVTRWALRGLRQRGRPKVIYTAHGFHFYQGGNSLKNAIFLWLEKLAGQWTDYLIIINREDEQAAKRYQIVPADRIVFMPGIGVDTSAYDPDRVPQERVVSVRSELGLMNDVSFFLMIAEFNPGKRHCDALHAFALINNKKAHFAFAGEGRLRKSVEALAHTLGVHDRIHFLGHRKDIPTLIRASVATVLPSVREGLPRSVMESLCLEIPVIGTDIRGVRDLLEGGCGLIVPACEPSALAAAMDTILAHPDEAAQMGRKGRKKMLTFDIRQILRLHEELYAKALDIRSLTGCTALSQLSVLPRGNK